MKFSQMFSPASAELPFDNYAQYTSHLFACVDHLLNDYVSQLMDSFTSGNGSTKNILYPDLEIAKNT